MEISIHVLRVLACGSNLNFNTTANNIEDAIAIADRLATGKAEPTVKETKVDAKKDSAKTATKENGAADATKEKSVVVLSEKPQNEAKTETAVVDYAAAAKAITDVATAKGREIAIAFLQRFGVKGGKELKPEQYADVVAMGAKILAGELDPTASCADELA